MHTPLEVDEKYSSPYVSLVSDRDRQVLGGMISAVDAGLSAIVERMKARGMWDNTLLIFTTDNGDHSPTPTTQCRQVYGDLIVHVISVLISRVF